MMKRTLLILCLIPAFVAPARPYQDWIRTGTGLGVERVRLAVPDFQPGPGGSSGDALRKVFNETLWNDLSNAGIFDVVSRSFYPLAVPGAPAQMRAEAWSNPPPSAGMVAFGNFGTSGEDAQMQGWLYDVKNPASPLVLGKQYSEKATEENARRMAHRFANEIILRLGGGVPGVAESRIVFISNRTGNKEVWMMDYDGAGQQPLTKLGSIALSPRISPDGSRVVFTSYARGAVDLAMYSLELGRVVSFPRFAGTNISPAWSPDGSKIAFSSSMRGDPEIFVVDSSGANPKRLTAYQGPDLAPTWNPKTGAQLAFVSGRTGLPQIYIMDADGTNLQRITDQGYAVSPSWSPNGQLLAFSWNRKYGPGAPGGQDIYIMDIASRQWVQLTHNAGNNDFPSWSPDGRHIVFQSTRSGRTQIWSMLADGTEARQLTSAGQNSQPNWSFK
ncbi:MAG TPA: Tol-Pal system beta propeller repeat protein TolB [Terriglobales bacterium]|nr:Tol-Pal system beta propeller repeat protein TolB [Terriglobales bacterium]